MLLGRRAVSASVSAVMPFPGVGAASSSAPCAAACDVFGAVPTLGFVVFGSFATVPPPGKVWKPSNLGFKINVDASIDNASNSYGLGVVVRNFLGTSFCCCPFS
ncbi:hypothetical protein ACOSQ2_013407 [Xanthoceras sorbifolium]